MKKKTNTKYYSKLIAKKHSLDIKAVHKILITCSWRIVKLIKDRNDLHIENCLNITTHKQAWVNYYKKAKENNQNKINPTK